MPTGHRGPPETDSIRVAYEGYLGPATWAIVHWFKVLYTGSASLADQEYVNQHLATALHDNLLANACSNDLHLTTVRSTVFLTSGERIRKVSVMDAVGGISSSSEPSSIAYLIDWATTDGRQRLPDPRPVRASGDRPSAPPRRSRRRRLADRLGEPPTFGWEESGWGGRKSQLPPHGGGLGGGHNVVRAKTGARFPPRPPLTSAGTDPGPPPKRGG